MKNCNDIFEVYGPDIDVSCVTESYAGYDPVRPRTTAEIVLEGYAEMNDRLKALDGSLKNECSLLIKDMHKAASQNDYKKIENTCRRLSGIIDEVGSNIAYLIQSSNEDKATIMTVSGINDRFFKQISKAIVAVMGKIYPDVKKHAENKPSLMGDMKLKSRINKDVQKMLSSKENHNSWNSLPILQKFIPNLIVTCKNLAAGKTLSDEDIENYFVGRLAIAELLKIHKSSK